MGRAPAIGKAASVFPLTTLGVLGYIGDMAQQSGKREGGDSKLAFHVRPTVPQSEDSNIMKRDYLVSIRPTMPADYVTSFVAWLDAQASKGALSFEPYAATGHTLPDSAPAPDPRIAALAARGIEHAQAVTILSTCDALGIPLALDAPAVTAPVAPVAPVAVATKPEGIPFPPAESWAMFLYDHAGRRLTDASGQPLDIRPTPISVMGPHGRKTSDVQHACYPDGSARKGWKLGDPLLPKGVWWSYNATDGGIGGAYRFKHQNRLMSPANDGWMFADTDRAALIAPKQRDASLAVVTTAPAPVKPVKPVKATTAPTAPATVPVIATPAAPTTRTISDVQRSYVKALLRSIPGFDSGDPFDMLTPEEIDAATNAMNDTTRRGVTDKARLLVAIKGALNLT